MNIDGLKSERMQLVISQAELDAIDKWRGQKLPIPSRSKAVRVLVKKGLEAEAEEQGHA